MKSYVDLSREELLALQQELSLEYERMKEKNLKLDMSRGKPSPAQLDFANAMLDSLTSSDDFKAADGTDVRNYGILDGLKETKEIFGDLLGVEAKNVLVGGNSSLNLMYDAIARAYTHGVCGAPAWCKADKVKFLCIVPGYDRHFAITESFGFENISVPMLADGPDMDMVEKLVSEDADIKGIWCVPKYSNPTGNTYSDEVVKRFAALKPAAEDFRIFWDNAYAIHDLYEDDKDELLNIFDEAKKYDNEDLIYMFASTSKVSFAGAGVAVLVASEKNLADIKKQFAFQTIGHDKVNQLRHVRYFKDANGIRNHMKKHADSLRPKFEAVLDILSKELGDLGIVAWTEPKGGYFISLDTMEGCAKAVVAKCKEAGVVMTGAGATFPSGKDPQDRNIRIAPSYPSAQELSLAAKLLCLSVKLVSLEKLLV